MSAQIIMFVPRPNPTREKLIAQAKANYEAIFPTLIEIIDTAIAMTAHDAAIFEAPPKDCA